MALPIPNLDDRTFSDLMEEAKRLIPRYCPEWTNFNPADPGITILELLAWLTETVLFRINQVPEANYQRFLELMGTPLADGEALEAGIRRAVAAVYEPDRAITTDDIVQLVKQCLAREFPRLTAQVFCYQDGNGGGTDAGLFQSGVTVVILTEPPVPPGNLYAVVRQFLTGRQLIGCQIRIVAPQELPVGIEAWVTIKPGYEAEQVANQTKTLIESYYNSFTGGPQGQGWPPGRGIYPSELFRLLERTPGVDHSVRLSLTLQDKEVEQIMAAPDQWVKPEVKAVHVISG